VLKLVLKLLLKLLPLWQRAERIREALMAPADAARGCMVAAAAAVTSSVLKWLGSSRKPAW
jgi:hypothetical protein